ncbi:hypothetical protein LCGC14_3021500, partial [marine sediment metagenome]
MQRKTKTFSSYTGPIVAPPDFIEIQYSSFKWFLEKGLKELFDEISPISDYTGKNLELHFRNFYFDEPKHDEEFSRYK